MLTLFVCPVGDSRKDWFLDYSCAGEDGGVDFRHHFHLTGCKGHLQKLPEGCGCGAVAPCGSSDSMADSNSSVHWRLLEAAGANDFAGVVLDDQEAC
jgi:hypothetical protein